LDRNGFKAYTEDALEKQDGAFLYVAKFNRDYSSFVAGGAGRDELRGFDWATGDL